jgi:HAD superfamily hydrolase (TIGR01509 family)
VDRAQGFLFDLDGTLVDSVYQHVLAWRLALDRAGIDLSVWRIHRKVGMSGGLFANALLRETGREVTDQQAGELRRLHAEAYAERSTEVRPLPGARELLSHLTSTRVPWAIATSGYRESAGPTLELLELPEDVPVITRDLVERAKPDPDLFLAAADALGMAAENCVVVGDSVWDLLAASGSACCPAATASRSSSAPARTASTTTRPTSSVTSTRSASASRYGRVPRARCKIGDVHHPRQGNPEPRRCEWQSRDHRRSGAKEVRDGQLERDEAARRLDLEDVARDGLGVAVLVAVILIAANAGSGSGGIY